MKKIISLILVSLMFALSLVGCSSLSEKEKKVFESVKELSKDFLSPGDVRIIEVGEEYHVIGRYGSYFRAVPFKIQGENASGGKNVDTYYLPVGPITNSDVEKVVKEEINNGRPEYVDDEEDLIVSSKKYIKEYISLKIL